MVDETFDCFELPGVPGGFRGALTDGIAKYLGIRFASYSAGGRQAAMEMYPEAYCRLVKAVAEEARRRGFHHLTMVLIGVENRTMDPLKSDFMQKPDDTPGP